jgi:glycosyltransferase involved in cell wall biosynthesis
VKVLLIAPFFDRTVPGESWCTYKWVRGISEKCDATVLTTHSFDWNPVDSPAPARAIVNWEFRPLSGRMARLGYELKPQYMGFYLRARRWIKAERRRGWSFDLVHQVNPVAVRYPSPVVGLGVTYLTGPHAGSLPTPSGFLSEGNDDQWFRKLRALDGWRIRHDPWLKNSLAGAASVMGVAPYLNDLLRPAGVKRFDVMAETGPEVVVAESKPEPSADRPLRLLFVGRVIWTKGVIHAIQAVALAASRAKITLDIVGTGDMADACRAEAERLSVSHIVTFHGRRPRTEVYQWYKKCDVFLFPSFREPSGTVVFEALGFGLPIITATTGGPGYVVTPHCGITVNPETPEQYARDLAEAIIRLASNRSLVALMSKAALQRVDEVASWDKRLDRLMTIYRDVLADRKPV